MVDWTDTLAPGRHEIRLDFDYDGGGLGQGGTARLSVDGASPVAVRVPATIRLLMPLSETFDVGVDTGTPVREDSDRKSGVEGQRVSVRLALGGGRIINKKRRSTE